MAYEDTEVPVERSQGKIRDLLLKNGATGVAFIMQTDPPAEGFEAMVTIDEKPYRIRIVANCRANKKGKEQETRRIWRVLFFHLKSIYEASNSGVMEFRELMLAYVVVRDGRTVAQHLLPQMDRVISGNAELLLGDGK